MCKNVVFKRFYDEPLPCMSQQLILDILPAPSPTLAGFVTGANAAVLQAVQSLGPGELLYLWGGAGSGRSHLLQATARTTGRYVPADQAEQVLAPLAWDDATVPEAVVAVDDVHTLTAPAQAALFGLINRWRASMGTSAAFALLCAGDRAPRTLPLREDLRTRLAWGQVLRLEHLSDAQRAQALREQAQSRGLPLSDEVLQWILTHQARDMGALMALMDALDRYSLARHRAITLPLLKELLAHLSDPS